VKPYRFADVSKTIGLVFFCKNVKNYSEKSSFISGKTAIALLRNLSVAWAYFATCFMLLWPNNLDTVYINPVFKFPCCKGSPGGMPTNRFSYPCLF
jgi:hypothetical protein